MNTTKTENSVEKTKKKYEHELDELRKKSNELEKKLKGLIAGDIITSNISELSSRESINETYRDLTNITELSTKFLSEFVFEVTSKTFNSYKTVKNLPSHICEKTIKLKELYSKGVELFGSVKIFNEWLNKESYGLTFHKPLLLMNTVIGIDMVLDELYKIEFGATA